MPDKHQIAHKFTIGDTVWTVVDNQVVAGKVIRLEVIVWRKFKDSDSLVDISYDIDPVKLSKDLFRRSERKLFATKQELLDSL